MAEQVMPPDPFQGAEWDSFVRSVIDGPESLTRKIYTSAVGLSLVPDEATEVDVKFAIELGFMVMYDKPIVAVVRPGAPVPDKLRLVADHIVEVDFDDPESQQRLSRALQKILREEETDG